MHMDKHGDATKIERANHTHFVFQNLLINFWMS